MSLDELRIFLGPDGVQSNYGSGMLNGVSPIYNLDNGVDNWIKLDIALNPAGTVGDMVAYIPNSLFANPGSNPYVYLYSKFGDERHCGRELRGMVGQLAARATALNPGTEPTGLRAARLRPCRRRSAPAEVSAQGR